MTRGFLAGASLAAALVLSACGTPTSTTAPTTAPAPSASSAGEAAPVRIYRLGSGWTLQSSRMPALHPVPAGAGALCGPHFGVVVDQVATVTEFDAEHMLGLNLYLPNLTGKPVFPVQAAPDHEFVLAHLADNTYCGSKHDPTKVERMVVQSGDQSLPVTTGLPIGGGALIVVDVAKTAPALVKVVDAGREQALDLRTGKADPAIAGFNHPPDGGANLDGKVGKGIMRASAGGTLYPYVDDKGWAAPGRGWLVLNVSVIVIGVDPVPTLWAEAFTVTGPEGRLPTAGLLTAGPAAGGRISGEYSADFTFDVPYNTSASYTVRFTPKDVNYKGPQSTSFKLG